MATSLPPPAYANSFEQSCPAVRPSQCAPRIFYNNLLLACLPRFLTNAHLMKHFALYNPLRATIMMDAATGRSKGYGFILFNNENDGMRVIAEMNGRLVSIGGTTFTLRVGPSVHDGFSVCTESPSIYVRNIPSSVSADRVAQHFSQFGAIVRLELRPASDEVGNLLLLAEFNSIECARKAISETNGHRIFPECAIPVISKFAESLEDKARRKFTRGPGGLCIRVPTMVESGTPPRNGASPTYSYSASNSPGFLAVATPSSPLTPLTPIIAKVSAEDSTSDWKIQSERDDSEDHNIAIRVAEDVLAGLDDL